STAKSPPAKVSAIRWSAGLVPSPSSITWPNRETIWRLATLPLATPKSSAELVVLYTPPSTMGRVTSPPSKPTITSSLTSGTNVIPPDAPAPIDTTRAQALSTWSPSVGYLTFTEPLGDSELPVFVTTPTTSASCRKLDVTGVDSESTSPVGVRSPATNRVKNPCAV